MIQKKNSKNIISVLKTYKTDLKNLFEELGENNEFKELYTLNNEKITLNKFLHAVVEN